jgi:hypothetical protein
MQLSTMDKARGSSLAQTKRWIGMARLYWLFSLNDSDVEVFIVVSAFFFFGKENSLTGIYIYIGYTEVWIQGLKLAKQAVYHLRHTYSPKTSVSLFQHFSFLFFFLQ